MVQPRIRPATRADLDTMIDWAAVEGWNPGLDDADVFFAADKEGFLIAEVDGAPAACISVVRYDLAPVFETARMYRGDAPDLPLDRTFGVTTFELG